MRTDSGFDAGRDGFGRGGLAVSAKSIEDMLDTSLGARWKRRRRFIIPVFAVLAVAGAFAIWGPIGIGPGPIGNTSYTGSTTAPVSRTQPAIFEDSIYAGDSGAVIDSIALVSDGSYPPPRVLAIKGDGDQVCGGEAWPLTGRQNFYAVCTAGRLVPLIGRPVPENSHLSMPGLAAPDYPGIGAAIEIAPPGSAGCWSVTEVVIHYHVGIRHYTATHLMDLTQCWSKSRLAALRQQQH
jgi:hypothetical protein